MKFGVKIMPRDVILDTQGRAIEHTLNLNHNPVLSCRVGKYIEVEVSGTADEALQKVKNITEFVLHNPLIEKYEIENLSSTENQR